MNKEPPTINRSPPIICVIFTFPFFFLQGWIQKQLRFSLFKTWHLVTNQIPKTIEFASLFAMVVVMVMRMMMTTMTTMKMTVTIMTALEKNQNLRKLFYALPRVQRQEQIWEGLSQKVEMLLTVGEKIKPRLNGKIKLEGLTNWKSFQDPTSLLLNWASWLHKSCKLIK